ncbi:MAG: sensor histidine kinase [Lachnospiraceae bacterium]|nr:sensor histidine kinase [Lachnospiraceae bacterium]
MAGIFDRLILLGCGILLMFGEGTQIGHITGVLIAICLSSIFLYTEARAVKTALLVVYAFACCAVPEFLWMSPVVLYEAFLMRQYWQSAIFFFAFLLAGGEPWILLLWALALLLCQKTSGYEGTLYRLHELQDEHSELKSKAAARQTELLQAQDYEVHVATLTERNRIAREIHDNVGHLLSRSILQVGALRAICKEEMLAGQLGALQETLDNAMNRIRESVHDLRDEAYDLQLAVRKLTEGYPGLEVSLDYDMSESATKNLKYSFVAIIQEALTNTVKHSDATKVAIVLREHPAMYQLVITDNGSAKHAADHEGMGLENMRERVEAFGGSLRISREQGFRIFAIVPKNEKNSEVKEN